MKTFTILTCVGTAIIYLMIGFVQWELNAGLWSQDLRSIFVLSTIGWISIAAMIRAVISDIKDKC
jgi:ABC-type dipeptide/oligopeptide/nickel transport system permease subunit